MFESIYILWALNTGTCINRLCQQAGRAVLFRGLTQEPALATANTGKTREVLEKMQVNGPEG